MSKTNGRTRIILLATLIVVAVTLWAAEIPELGREIAVPHHLRDGQEFSISLQKLLSYGEKLFRANFTVQEGAGRPLSKGTGAPVSDLSDPLTFPRNFNRISGPESNSCAGCHNQPFVGGGGDRATEVFVLAQRFDFATFDHSDPVATKGALDERGIFVTHNDLLAPSSADIANERKTIGMFGSGFIEMLARQMTAELQASRDATMPGQVRRLVTKGISFGSIRRNPDGSWDTSGVEGLPAPSVATNGASNPPSLIIMPFHQAGAAVSVRQFTNNAFNHHHGMQAEERFGLGVDADGDGIANELTIADITAATLWQATLPVPGRVFSRDPQVRAAEKHGEIVFSSIGCASCHVTALPLTAGGWIYSEPNPYNPTGNLQPGASGYPLKIDLTSEDLPWPRLRQRQGVVMVPAFTDLKLHDITSGPDDPNREPLDQNHAAGSPGFFQGNRRFITRKLWDSANSGPFMHHGKFTTMREAILAHSGEALTPRRTFQAIPEQEQASVIEFLKTLQVLPPGTHEREIESVPETE